MEKMKFTVLGGDERSLCLAYELMEDGHHVKIFGFDKLEKKLDIEESNSLIEAIKDVDIIIGPLPFTRDEKTINAPFYSGKIDINNVIKLVHSEQLLTVGKVDEDILELFNKNNINIKDYFHREEMQILNAIPTAEGAIELAMAEMPITIHGSNILILGYGRIGKVLSKMIQGIGATVYVAARKYSDIAWIKSCGYNPVLFKDIEEHLYNMDLVFNTVPELILDEYMLNKFNGKSIVIDLASKPGGVDFEKAEALGVKVNHALGLPGKAAPVTAARVIKETVYNIVREWGN